MYQRKRWPFSYLILICLPGVGSHHFLPPLRQYSTNYPHTLGPGHLSTGCYLFIYFIFIYLFIWLPLGLHCCMRAFSSCGQQGLLFVVVHGPLVAVASLVEEHGLQAHRLQQLWLAGSRAQAQELWRTGLVALRHVRSSWTRDRTRVPCIGRQILNHCVTREVPGCYFITLKKENYSSTHPAALFPCQLLPCLPLLLG